MKKLLENKDSVISYVALEALSDIGCCLNLRAVIMRSRRAAACELLCRIAPDDDSMLEAVARCRKTYLYKSSHSIGSQDMLAKVACTRLSSSKRLIAFSLVR